MRSVKVLLREPVKDLGIPGDIVQVRPGYARNFLIPKRLAVEATPDNIRLMDRRRLRYEAGVAAQQEEIERLIAKLGEIQLATKEKADEKGTLYGSVSAATVAQLLDKAGYPAAEKDVRLDEPIKTVGSHEVLIHIHGEHYASVRLEVETAD